MTLLRYDRNIFTSLRDKLGNVIYKCPICNLKFTNIVDFYKHVEKVHGHLIPEGMTTKQFLFHMRNDKPLDERHGDCMICKDPTLWKEETGKYKRLCEKPTCKEMAREQYKNRVKNKYGTDNLMKDPEYQKMLQENRDISRIYEWKDGSEISCMGSYEYDFIEYCEKTLGMSSDSVVGCPHIFYYVYEDKKLFYMPDFYMPEYDLIIEIKDGGNNPNTHHKIQSVDKEKERLKDLAIIESKKHNYIKITNKEYSSFEALLNMFNSEEYNTRKDNKKIIHIPQK